MELSHAELSSPGPVRQKNEDFAGFWQAQPGEEMRSLGAVAALAGGVRGMDLGEVASRLAVEASLAAFREAGGGLSTQQRVTRVFEAANRAVHDRAMERHGENRTAATLCLVVLLNDEIVVGNLGDSRVYLVRNGEIRLLSTSHRYVEMLQKFGMISEQDARISKHREGQIRGVGQEMDIRVDLEQTTALEGDRVVLCSAGLYLQVSDEEIAESVSRLSPAQACRQLVALAESRGAEDNLSIQVIQISEVAGVSNDDGVAVPSGTLPKSSGYDLQVGQTVDQRFLLTETISRSGMATIFKATDLVTKKDVALKVPFMQYESDPGFYSRFLREEKIGLLLDHPYILKFIPVESRSRPYIVTEYLQGHTLAHLLKRMRPMPETDAVRLASRMCEALIHMHAHGVIHRDLKPQNIMILLDGSIRILDFGIAKSTGRRFTFAGFTPAMGTPEYMAPEQVKGRRGDERTDIYSLGAMLYEMVVGAIPFASRDQNEDVFVAMNARVTGDPEAPRKLNRELSEQVEEIVLHAMERDPGKRYQSVAAMKEELDQTGEVELTGRCDRLQRPVPWKRHLKSALLVGIAISSVVFGLVKLILMILHRGP
jgi:serine/threonine protein phosphatase PrpC